MYVVLVDCDNISSKKIDLVFNEIKSCGGHAVIRLLFGDFNSGSLKPWDKKAKEWSFDKVKTPLIITGKSSVDATLIKKGLEIVHQVDGFAIVSSDSDFMPLALNLQKSGKHVIGFGMKKTLLKYRNACDHFVYLDSAACDSSPDSTAYAKLQSIVKNLKSENGWTDISSVGQQLQKSDRKALGISRKKLTKFFIASTQHFEFSRHCQAGVVRCARHGRRKSRCRDRMGRCRPSPRSCPTRKGRPCCHRFAPCARPARRLPWSRCRRPRHRWHRR